MKEDWLQEGGNAALYQCHFVLFENCSLEASFPPVQGNIAFVT